MPEPALIVTFTAADVTMVPLASRATAVKACEPAGAVTDVEYGALVSSAPAFWPSTRNCTPTTPAEAVAAIENAFGTVAPPDGDVMDTVIGDCADAVKSTPVTSAPLMVAFRLEGVNAKPLLPGITAYDPFANPLNT